MFSFEQNYLLSTDVKQLDQKDLWSCLKYECFSDQRVGFLKIRKVFSSIILIAFKKHWNWIWFDSAFPKKFLQSPRDGTTADNTVS